VKDKKYGMNETICALATAPGVGAIAVIRVSGPDTFDKVSAIFKGKNLKDVPGNTVVFGTIRDGEKVVDEVLISVFKGPKSFTKEDTVEISTHGSDYIIRYVLKLLVKQGCRMAMPGEFTQRAFLNGQFDLVQAEAVADLIAADSEAAHKLAMNQLRGGFSKKLAELREKLIHFASLVELELDFGEEDVEFADREDLRQLILKLEAQIKPLIDSFENGNAIKEGIPVAIIGPPNAGKSTLLNALLNEEKAIVTAIAGTTRDVIEDVLFLGGVKFRIIDTAGIRETEDVVESMGIERSLKAMEKADILLLLFDNEQDRKIMETLVNELPDDKKKVWVQTKIDLEGTSRLADSWGISAKTGEGLDELKAHLIDLARAVSQADSTLTNVRHFEQLTKTYLALEDVLEGLSMQVTGDFLAQDIRMALHHLGEITGTITTDDLLANIFSKFCIGK
jgi:tRNA modification GTPase